MMERATKEIAELQHLISTLPKARGWMCDSMYQYQGFWYHPAHILGTLLAKNQPFFCSSSSSSSDHVLLASYPKSGTTWLKSLLFAIENRVQFPTDCTTHPLLTTNSHECIPFIEFLAYNNPSNPVPDNCSLLSTHIPFHSLPDSVVSSNCHIVYVYREPKDVLISMWHFATQYRMNSKETALRSNLVPLEEAFDQFIQGESGFGPYWDHVLTYWEQSLRTPNRILFVSYVELKRKPVDCLKTLACFIGKPFSVEEEERDRVPEKIIDFCNFDKMRNLDVNQPQSINKAMPTTMKIPNSLFFRKGEVGDHQNYMTEEMIERIDKMTKKKLRDAGFPSDLLVS